MKTKTLKVVEFRRDKKNGVVPAIILQGNMLKEINFLDGAFVDVLIDNGVITIKLNKPSSKKPPLKLIKT